MYNIKYPVAFHPVDMAITRMFKGRIQVLLAQKVKDSIDPASVWRFPGGFIDPWDSCAEEAALRESMEETGMRFGGTKRISESFDNYFNAKKPLTEKLTSLIELMQNVEGNQAAITSVIKQIEEIKISDATAKWLRDNVEYIGSTKIDDARYRDTDHKVITSFYELKYTGEGDAGEGPFDDIARTKWFYLSEVTPDIQHPSHTVLFNMLVERYRGELIADKILADTDEFVKNVEDVFVAFKKGTNELFADIKTHMPEYEKKAEDTLDVVSEKIKKAFEKFTNG